MYSKQTLLSSALTDTNLIAQMFDAFSFSNLAKKSFFIFGLLCLVCFPLGILFEKCDNFSTFLINTIAWCLNMLPKKEATTQYKSYLFFLIKKKS